MAENGTRRRHRPPRRRAPWARPAALHTPVLPRASSTWLPSTRPPATPRPPTSRCIARPRRWPRRPPAPSRPGSAPSRTRRRAPQAPATSITARHQPGYLPPAATCSRPLPCAPASVPPAWLVPAPFTHTDSPLLPATPLLLFDPRHASLPGNPNGLAAGSRSPVARHLLLLRARARTDMPQIQMLPAHARGDSGARRCTPSWRHPCTSRTYEHTSPRPRARTLT
ncbi:hypothetical protein OBBRIDRAFT_833375 [Obba rivulosa]|uniref:Uncharacterized protein n=1 Tax=Obba rivulosa TaxID=1052685 RepID=A0A8E2B1V4_9APHY|nr:hypothetical protein OBBRIDRAFT_833375 [Obba rivulosa]